MTPMQTSELEAVNLMLATISLISVSTLAQSGQITAVIAQQTPTETAVDIQSGGWHFDMDKGFHLKPAASAL